MGAIELLRKYAAEDEPSTATVKPKKKDSPTFNLERIPLKGERVYGYGDVDDDYINSWWDAYDAKHVNDPYRMQRKDIDERIGNLQDYWNQQVEDNKNTFFSNKENASGIWTKDNGDRHWYSYLNPLNWKGLYNITGGLTQLGSVSSDWLAEQSAYGKNDNAAYSGLYKYDDKHNRDDAAMRDLEWRIRGGILNSDERNKDYRAVDRRATGAAHVTGQVLDAATMGIGSDWYTKKVTGENISDLASTYGKLYAQDYGEEAARRAEFWLRMGGWGAHAAVDAVWLFGASPSTLNNLGGVSQKGLRWIPNVPGRLAAYINTASKTSRFARMLGVGAKATKAFIAANRTGHMLADAANVTSEVLQDKLRDVNPNSKTYLALAGANAAAKITAFIGKDAGQFAAMGIVGNAVGAGLQGVRLPGKLQSIGTQTARLMNWATKPTRNPVRWALNKYVQGALNEGLMWGTYENIERALSNDWTWENWKGALNPLAYAGMKTNLIGRMGVLPLGDYLGQRYSSKWRTFQNAGNYDKAMQADKDRLLGNPDEMKQFRESTAQIADGLGLVGPVNDQTYLDKVLPAMYASQSTEIMTMDWCKKLNSSFDWENSTPEQAQQELAKYTPEQRAKAKMRVYNMHLSNGGAFDFMPIFMDPDLNAEQRNELLHQYAGSEWLAQTGRWKMPFVGWGDKAKLKTVMQKPGMHNAVVEYGRRACVETVAGTEAPTKIDDLAELAVGELTLPEQRDMVSTAVHVSTPEQLANFTTNATEGSISTPVLQEAIEAEVKDRMVDDNNFAADYAINMCAKLNDGANLSSDAMEHAVDLVDEVGVDALLDSTDPDRIQALMRLMGSEEGREKLKGLGPKGERLLEEFKEKIPSYAMNAIMENPLKNLPSVVGMWLQSKGYGGVASIVSNPFVFYSMLVLLMSGGFTLMRNKNEPGDKANAADLMGIRNLQQYRAMLS